jgi:hypothetical protein
MNRILEEISNWEPQARISLARHILQTLEAPEVSTPPKQKSLNQIFGLLKTDKPAPTDEECEQIIEEERMRKYG